MNHRHRSRQQRCHDLCILLRLRSVRWRAALPAQALVARRIGPRSAELSLGSASGVECPVGSPLRPWAPAITSTAADGGSVLRSLRCAPVGPRLGGAAWPLAPRNRWLAPKGQDDRALAEQPRGPLRASRGAPFAPLKTPPRTLPTFVTDFLRVAG